MEETLFVHKKEISPVAKNILEKRYFQKGEKEWGDVIKRVIDFVLSNEDDETRKITEDMIRETYFVPNSPCLVNAGKEDAGLLACFVVDFPDDIEGIYKTKLDFALIARKGGGCGTSLSKIRPEGAIVHGSTHGYAGGGVKFADTISHDADALTQSGFRSMAIMFTETVYHPDILKFITAKEVEGVIANANMSVVVDDKFMRAVQNDEKYWTEYTWDDEHVKAFKKEGSYNKRLWKNNNTELYNEYKARDIFNIIIEGAWRNGEPGILFKTRIDKSPYSFTGQEIFGTNPCLSGETLIQTVEGEIAIKDLVGKEIDVYCQIDDNQLGISRAFNIRKTKKDAELVQILTTRGDLVCTPDHLIYTKNRGYVQAKDLLRSDSLSGLNQKMMSECYKGISLTGTNKYIKEHRFVAGYYFDINGKAVHHKDGNTLNNKLSNLEVIDMDYHAQITNKGHDDWNEHDSKGMFVGKEDKKKRKSVKLDYYPTGVNLKILKIKKLPYTEDVYDMEVEKYHNFIANNLVVHNCSEQPLPPNGSCNLGSIDLSKFVTDDGEIDYYKLSFAVIYGIRFLDSVIDVTSYPTKEIEIWAKDNRPVGLGIMGFADACLMLKIPYGSAESLALLEEIEIFIGELAKETSIELGKEKGIPNECAKLPVPRRNITLTTIAPTGTVSLIAGCSSGIEPIFSEITIRNDKTGTYTFENDLANQPYFRCAVSSNGAREVTWEEHINVLATAQKYIDSGVSKTINFPTNTHRETIAKAVMMAWEKNCKGIAVYRNGSRKQEVLSPKNLKKDKCPICGNDLVTVDGKQVCVSCKQEDIIEKTVGSYDS